MRAPQGRHHARGLEAPESGRFKGLWGFQRGLRGESELPCPLWPSPGRRPARRRLNLSTFVIIAFLSEGERTSGGARGTMGDCDLPPKVPLDSHYPLQTPTLGDFQSPGVVPSPGAHGVTSDVLLPRALRFVPRALRVLLAIATFPHAPLRDRTTGVS